MILEAITPDAEAIDLYEWKINDVIFPSPEDPAITQTIEADLVTGDVVTVRALNECATGVSSWSAPVSITIGKEDDDMLLYLIVFAVAYALFTGMLNK